MKLKYLHMETLIIILIVIAVAGFILFNWNKLNNSTHEIAKNVGETDLKINDYNKLDKRESFVEKTNDISIDDIDKTCITKKMLEQIEKGDFFHAKLKALDLFNNKLDKIHDKYDSTHNPDENEDEENIDVSKAYPYAQNYVNLKLMSYQKEIKELIGTNNFYLTLSTKNISGCIKPDLDEKKFSYNEFIKTKPIPCTKDCPARYSEYRCCILMLESVD